MRIAIVAGETSGDMLGSGLLTELKKLYPTATFEGIGGPMMQARGLHSHFPMERLSVMGLIEVLGRLFELLSIRKSLIQRWTDDPPDLFIGIDAPDFNLTLEEKLRERGVKTVHYVSPSVWAWRQKRVFEVARAVDLMLTLFPFEARFYEQHKVAVRCVGHHLADKIPMQTPFAPARKELGLSEMDSVICLMPGSRGGEVERLGPLFLETAQWLLRRRPEYRFVIPAASVDRRNQLEQQLSDFPFELPIEIVLGKSRTCIAASDAVLVASGTATLEVMLLKRPMVVSYKVNQLTAFLLKRMLKQPFVSLPNLLAGEELVPELLQERATPMNLAEALLQSLENQTRVEKTQQTYQFLHRQLKRGADEQAAKAISELLDP